MVNPILQGAMDGSGKGAKQFFSEPVSASGSQDRTEHSENSWDRNGSGSPALEIIPTDKDE